MRDKLPAVTAIGRVDLNEAIEAQLRELILSGRLAPGQRLVEAELAVRFGTSRGPVRDALASLERGGLVTAVARTGSFVVDLTPADVEELYSLRMSLEDLAVRRAVTRATTHDLSEMDRSLRDLSAAMAANDPRVIAECDMRFHRAIVRSAEHRRLLGVWEGVSDQILLVMRELPAVSQTVQADSGQHRVVLEAIADGDEAAATAAMRAHLVAALQAMLSSSTDRRP